MIRRYKYKKTCDDIFELESEERRADKSRTVERVVEHNNSGDPGHGHVVVFTD
jgi:hypothetical protein